jgi:hypothetical protein
MRSRSEKVDFVESDGFLRQCYLNAPFETETNFTSILQKIKMKKSAFSLINIYLQ